MRLILVWAVVLIASTMLSTLMFHDNGQISIVWNDWVIETSISFLFATILVFFAIVYLLIRGLTNLYNLPKWWQHSRRLRRYIQAEDTMVKGMIALEYGDWQRAEKLLIKSAKYSNTSLVHYLSAAKMADNQQAYERRDGYLKQAKLAHPEGYVTIGLVEARLYSKDQPEISLSILERLNEQCPKHKIILAEYATGLRHLKHWDTLESLLPTLRKSRTFNKVELANLERVLLSGKITDTITQEALDQLWSELILKQKLITEVLEEYVERKIGWGQEKGLASWIEKSLKKQWSDRLAYQYGRIKLGLAYERLQTAEKWLKGQEQNPILLLSLGRLACGCQLWSRAHGYLQESLKIHSEVETFHALAQCYEAEGNEGKAALIYKQAILQVERDPLI